MIDLLSEIIRSRALRANCQFMLDHGYYPEHHPRFRELLEEQRAHLARMENTTAGRLALRSLRAHAGALPRAASVRGASPVRHSAAALGAQVQRNSAARGRSEVYMIRTIRTITGRRAYLVAVPCVCREAATQAEAIAALEAWLESERARMTDTTAMLHMERLDLLRALYADAKRGMCQAEATMHNPELRAFHAGAVGRYEAYGRMRAHYHAQIAELERELGLEP